MLERPKLGCIDYKIPRGFIVSKILSFYMGLVSKSRNDYQRDGDSCDECGICSHDFCHWLIKNPFSKIQPITLKN